MLNTSKSTLEKAFTGKCYGGNGDLHVRPSLSATFLSAPLARRAVTTWHIPSETASTRGDLEQRI